MDFWKKPSSGLTQKNNQWGSGSNVRRKKSLATGHGGMEEGITDKLSRVMGSVKALKSRTLKRGKNEKAFGASGQGTPQNRCVEVGGQTALNPAVKAAAGPEKQ